MRIIGPPSTTIGSVLAILPDVAEPHPRFVAKMFVPLWEAALAYGIDPVGVVAQAGKETKWGHYGGRVRAEFHNTCGLKVTAEQQGLEFREYAPVRPLEGDQPLAHAMFATWHVGARAHVQHLCAYAGLTVPVVEIVDPRYELVAGRHWCETFEDLGGRWAPAADYGVRLVDIARRLQGGA